MGLAATTVPLCTLLLALASAVPSSASAASTFSASGTLLGVIFGCFAQFLGNGQFVHLATDEFLDSRKAGLVVNSHKGDGASLGTSAGSTPDAVYIILAVARSILVDD